MALEIERKFLVHTDAYKAEATGSTRIAQGYIGTVPGRTVRIRVRGDKGYITIKGIGNASGAARFEWEKEIPVEEVKSLLELAEPGIIDKHRYLVPAEDGHVWEVDEFHGDNDGLIMAELEMKSENEPYVRPSFIGREVTGDRRFYNSHMRKNPYKLWKDSL